MQSELFDLGFQQTAPAAIPCDASLDQYFTPVWAARALWRVHFSDLGRHDFVMEPSCGPGRMLRAIPEHIPAVGIEIDPKMAAVAREETGRQIIIGDARKIELPSGVTAVFGNPPFDTSFLDALLDRLSPVLPMGAPAGFILPAYFFQTPSRVCRWNSQYSISQEMIPRTLFPGLSKPLVFAMFRRESKPILYGMRLYAEALAMENMAEESKREMEQRSGSWRSMVANALRKLGGTAHLSALYREIGKATWTEFWREKIRQTLQRGPFRPMGGGTWAIA